MSEIRTQFTGNLIDSDALDADRGALVCGVDGVLTDRDGNVLLDGCICLANMAGVGITTKEKLEGFLAREREEQKRKESDRRYMVHEADKEPTVDGAYGILADSPSEALQEAIRMRFEETWVHETWVCERVDWIVVKPDGARLRASSRGWDAVFWPVNLGSDRGDVDQILQEEEESDRRWRNGPFGRQG